MKLKIAVLPGDGIGPEIVGQALQVTEAVCKRFGHELSHQHAWVGACAIDRCGNPYPEETHKLCMESDAVLFGAIGDPKYDNNPSAKVRPEQGLLGMRKQLGLYANIRPVTTFSSLLHKSPLRRDIVYTRAHGRNLFRPSARPERRRYSSIRYLRVQSRGS